MYICSTQSITSLNFTTVCVLVCFLVLALACLYSPILKHVSKNVESMICLESRMTNEMVMDFRWIQSPQISVLEDDWVEMANIRGPKNYSWNCERNCGIHADAKVAFRPFNYTLSMHLGHSTRSIKPVSMFESCKCLQQFKTIFAFGDSHMRRILVSWMENSEQIMRNTKETHTTNLTLERAFLLPCAHMESRPEVFKLTAWRFEHLQEFVVPTLNLFQANNTEVDLLVVGFGLHNVMHPSVPEQIRRVYNALSSHPACKRSQFVWTLPHMVAMKGDAEYVTKVQDRNIFIRRYNDLVLDFFWNLKDPRWTVVDFFHLTRDRLILAQDAAHFEPTVFRWKNHVMINMICPQLSGNVPM
jgi:hypothetical protein